MLDLLIYQLLWRNNTEWNRHQHHRDYRISVTISICLPILFYLFAVEYLELSEIDCEEPKKE